MSFFFIAVTFKLLIFVVHLVIGIKLKTPIMCSRVKIRLSVFYNVFMYLIKSIEYPSCHTFIRNKLLFYYFLKIFCS